MSEMSVENDDIDKFMDHKYAIDTRFFKVELEKTKYATFTRCHYNERLTSKDLMNIAHKHNDRKNLKHPLKSCITFSFNCYCVGNKYMIHYHDITIRVYSNDGTIMDKTKHSAQDDGTLCLPKYYSFLISKISYFELTTQFPIYIDKRILSWESFRSENHFDPDSFQED